VSAAIGIIATALVLGSAYALVGLGYNLCFVALRTINFAQGQMYMVAAFVYAELFAHGYHIVPAVLIACALGAAMGLVIERGIISPVMNRGFTHGNLQASVLGTVAASIVIQEIANRLWGSTILPAPAFFGSGFVRIGTAVITYGQMTAVGGAIVLYILLWLLTRKTTVGLYLRATAANPVVTSLQGVNNRLVVSFAFSLAGVITAMAGILVSPLNGVSTSTGIELATYGMLAALVGGLGRMSGVIPAGYAMGFVEILVSYYWTSQYPDLVLYVVIFLTLVGPSLIKGVRDSQSVKRARKQVPNVGS
jgi:branched-subunit amino acid ABC-type transport system permease component